METTTRKNLDSSTVEYAGIASAQMNILKAYMEVSGLNIGTRRVSLNDGTEIICSKCYRQEEVIVTRSKTPIKVVDVQVIEVYTGGFIFHPRTDDFPYGIAPDGSPLGSSSSSAFPLIDNDHGSSLLLKRGNRPAILTRGRVGSENYGNLSDDNGKVSWRGAAGKYIATPGSNIPGFTRDRKSGEEYILSDPEYTPYARILYEGGKEVAPAPPGEVICSTIVKGKKWIVVQPLPESGDQILMQLVDGVWAEIGRRAAYTEVPCTFLADKVVVNNLVGSSGEWTYSGDWSDYAASSPGEELNGVYWEVYRDATSTVLHPNVILTVQSSDVTTLQDDWRTVTGSVPTVNLFNKTWHSGGGIGDINPTGGSIGNTYYSSDGLHRATITNITTVTVMKQPTICCPTPAPGYNGSNMYYSTPGTWGALNATCSGSLSGPYNNSITQCGEAMMEQTRGFNPPQAVCICEGTERVSKLLIDAVMVKYVAVTRKASVFAYTLTVESLQC